MHVLTLLNLTSPFLIQIDTVQSQRASAKIKPETRNWESTKLLTPFSWYIWDDLESIVDERVAQVNFLGIEFN